MVRQLFREYAASLEFDLDFQDFGEEMKRLPGDYAPPDGRLILAMINTEPVGCVALRRIDNRICEMKRLFTIPSIRGNGVGRFLVTAVIQVARNIRYEKMRLDTVPTMKPARHIYASVGFREIKPYRYNPIPGATYMELDLSQMAVQQYGAEILSMNREEIVTIVDEENNVVGSAPRSRMRVDGLPHRATYILVFNSEGLLFVQKRTTTKDIYPGYFDVATGGVVLSGESYETAALRELEEELGIQGVPLDAHFDFYHDLAGNRVWGRVYSCVYDGKMKLQEEEVESGAFHSIQEILEHSRNEPFTPDGIYVLHRYLAQGKTSTSATSLCKNR